MIDFIQRIPPWFWIALVAHFGVLGTVAYLILLERKVASWVQDRLGPNRVGFDFGIIPFLKGKTFNGLGQPLADGLKFLLKEDYRPRGVDKILFTIAPAIMIITVIISIAVIPWGGTKRTTKQIAVSSWAPGQQPIEIDDERAEPIRNHVPMGVEYLDVKQTEATGVLRGNRVYEPKPGQEADVRVVRLAHVTYQYPFQIANLNIGVLFVLAVLSLAVYGVVIGGWASNNKYSFLGGLRATANMISYEVPLGLAVLTIVLMFGSLDLADIVNKQAHYWAGFIPAWNVFCQPLAFFLFLVCIHAEANRAPFDLAEAEQELVGGYHTEYSAMRFALFFLAEYAGMITTSAVCVALFFGGWHLPGLGDDVVPGNPAVTTSLTLCIIRSLVFFGKTLLIIFVFMWTRWSLPRFRFDQLMMIAWRALIPISLALLMVTAVVVYLFAGSERAFGRLNGRMALALLVANAALLGITMVASMLVPPAPDTNRKIRIPNSRFARTPLPGSGTHTAPALNREAAEKLPVGTPAVAGRVGQ
jgi:NADH-quinone oxidoreductase subunit H